MLSERTSLNGVTGNCCSHDPVVRVDKRVKEILARREAARGTRDAPPSGSSGDDPSSATGADPTSLVLRCIASLPSGASELAAVEAEGAASRGRRRDPERCRTTGYRPA